MIKTRTVDYYPSVPGENVPTQYGYSREGVPNPYRHRLHNWRGGSLDEGNLYHGPNYYEPQFRPIWQPRPLWGIGGGSDMYRQDVRTRNGVFANQGFGGGIFNSNVALGADTLPTFDPTNAVIWGMPDPRFAVIQGKLNTFLVANGIAMVPMDGVLGDGYCKAIRDLGDVGGVTAPQHRAFLDSLSKSEQDMVLSAGVQCTARGFAYPCSFPEMQGNPACQGGGGGGGLPIPPSGCLPGQIQNPLTGQCMAIPVPKTCPAGQVWNPLTGACEMLSLPPTKNCPAGQIQNPLTGQCFSIPMPKACPTGQIWNPLSNNCEGLPPIPKTCPPGQVAFGGQCVPLDPLPKTCPPGQVSVGGQCMTPNPVLKCPGGTKLDANGMCQKLGTPAAASSSNAMLYIVGGVAAIGLLYFATRKR